MIRFVRMFALVAVLAGVFVSSASALAFADQDYFWPNGEVGTPYSKQLIGRIDLGPCTGTKCKFALIAGSFPPGISMSSTGLVSGTPTQLGTWSFWLEVRDCCGQSAQRQFSITVNSIRVMVTTNQLPAASIGKPYNVGLSGQGSGQLAWSIASGTLPAGLTLNSNGTITGTPTAVGDSTVTFKLTDTQNPQRSDTKILTLSVVEPLRLTAGPARPVAEVGRPFSTTVKATGGRAPYTWDQGTQLPSGFSFDTTTGVLSGSPDTPGVVPISLTLKDSLGTSVTLTLNLRIAAHLEISTTALRTASVGRAYTAKLAVTGGVRAFKWQVRGKLPAGLRLDARSGTIVGTPRIAGTFRITIRVRDALRVVSTKTIVLSIR